MIIHFWDTSGLVKRYIQEIGTDWVQERTAPDSGHSHFLARITLVETIAAITRRRRGGGLTPGDATIAVADFEYDFVHQYRVIEMSAGLIAHAALMAQRHGLRAYDAVQLAAAVRLHLQASGVILVSADDELNQAASAEGMLIEDPNEHPTAGGPT
jgi:predicted nucleic acid-binding protein